jgi:predicted DNA-binding protein
VIAISENEEKETICIEIPRDIYEELKQMAEELGVPLGALLRKLLEKH